MKYFVYLLFVLSHLAHAENSSHYTSVDNSDCIIVSTSEDSETPEIDFYSMKCASYAGYDVEVSGGDLRYDLKLSYQGKNIETEDAGGAFHDMGSTKIEWRYKKIKKGLPWNTEVKFTSLIYRITYTSYNSESGMPVDDDIMVVIKLDGKNSCQTGRLIASKVNGNLNEMAREIADNPEAACL